MKKKTLGLFWLLSFLEGMGVIGMLFCSPSEQGWLLGLSIQRWFLLFTVVLIEIFFLFFFLQISHVTQSKIKILFRLNDWIKQDTGLIVLLCSFSALALFLLGGWVFTYLFIPPAFRWILFWGFLFFGQFGICLIVDQWARVRGVVSAEWRKFFSHWENRSKVQKNTLRILLVIGFLYFVVCIIPNALDAFTPHIFSLKGGDENITYPYVVWMLSPADSIETAVYHFFVYEDYHYGYPFYFLSMLALLPVRIIAGANFAALTQINLLLLRQMVSVLPMILSALILTYLQTRFRSKGKSIALFLVMLLLCGMVRYNQRFWHPDALVVLCVSLTIFFLDRDKFRYKHNFYLAAFFCGLASAIKLFGFFFVLSIGGYILFGLIKKYLNIKRTALVSTVFLLVMFGTLIFANPFLFVRDARNFMLEIMEEKSSEVTEGYDEPDPEGVYQKGLLATLPYLKEPYALPFILAFLLISIAAAFAVGENRLVNGVLLGWVLMSGCYLIFYSAIKNYHYWLPAMIPLFSGFFGLSDALRYRLREGKIPVRWSWIPRYAAGATWLLVAFQLTWSTIQAARFWEQLGRIAEIIR